MVNSAEAEALVPLFQYERTLNQDQAGRRTALYGRIKEQPALLILERAPFPTSPDYLGSVAGSLRALKNLGANDVYFWFLGASGGANGGDNNSNSSSSDSDTADLKINLIWPCTGQHVKKYSRQGVRLVTETPAIYREHVRPFMQAQRDAGRLNWVYNILEGRQEAEDVIYRAGTAGTAAAATSPDDTGFLLLPDLNWDRRTLEALHLLALVERRDLWSLRDLRKRHVPWLRDMQARLLDATTRVYPAVERDQLKLYVHYQPTYYHFHIHIVHVQLEAGATQATGKAVGLESIVAQLELIKGSSTSAEDDDDNGENDDDVGMDAVPLTYTLGEASELWAAVFGPLKKAAQDKEAQRASDTK